MDHDRVQLNVLDYDLDIDSSQPPRRQVVVSVQDHFTPSDSEISDVTELQAEDHSTEESSNPIHNHSEVSHGYEYLPSGFQDTTTIACQDTTQYHADTDEI